MKTVKIINTGCDADTVFEMNLTDEQYDFVVKLCEANNEVAKAHCQPTLEVVFID